MIPPLMAKASSPLGFASLGFPRSQSALSLHQEQGTPGLYFGNATATKLQQPDYLLQVPNLHPDYSLRRGRPEDVDAIMAFIGQVFHDTYGEIGDKAFPPRQANIRKDVEAAIQNSNTRRACFFLVTHKETGDIAATLAVQPSQGWGRQKNQVKLSSVFTSSHHQKKGLSSALLDHVLKYLKGDGVKHLFFSTWEQHVHAHRMYEKREAVLLEHANEQYLMAFFLGKDLAPVHITPGRGVLGMHQYPAYLLNTVV